MKLFILVMLGLIVGTTAAHASQNLICTGHFADAHGPTSFIMNFEMTIDGNHAELIGLVDQIDSVTTDSTNYVVMGHNSDFKFTVSVPVKSLGEVGRVEARMTTSLDEDGEVGKFICLSTIN